MEYILFIKKVKNMKKRKRSFEELIKENKKELLLDTKQMERIEERLERKHMQKAE